MNRAAFLVRVVMCGLAVVSVPTIAAAQDTSRVEVSAGWRLLLARQELMAGYRETVPVGWYGEVAVNLSDTFAVVGDVAGAYKIFERTERWSSTVTNDVDADLRL